MARRPDEVSVREVDDGLEQALGFRVYGVWG